MPRAVHRLRTSAGTELPVIVLRSGRPGPTVAVTANLHGDELTGVGVVHALAERPEAWLRAGEVVLYPSLNPAGLARGLRTLPEDDRDLNRAFPGEARGSPSQKHARVVWEDLRARAPDLLIDLHADAGQALPYALVDRACRQAPAPRARLEARALEAAEASGLTVLREYPDETYLRFQLDHSLTGAVMNTLGVPALTLEHGPRGDYAPAAAEDLRRAVLGILSALGLAEAPAPPHPTRLRGGPWRREAGPRPRHGGLYQAHLHPGDPFSAGALLAELRALDGSTEALHTPQAGVVIALPARGWVGPGGSTGTIAVEGG